MLALLRGGATELGDFFELLVDVCLGESICRRHIRGLARSGGSINRPNVTTLSRRVVKREMEVPDIGTLCRGNRFLLLLNDVRSNIDHNRLLLVLSWLGVRLLVLLMLLLDVVLAEADLVVRRVIMLLDDRGLQAALI